MITQIIKNLFGERQIRLKKSRKRSETNLKKIGIKKVKKNAKIIFRLLLEMLKKSFVYY